MANVIFTHEDATVKIYQQSADGSRGSAVTTGLLYVRNIRLTEDPQYNTHPQFGQGAGVGRPVHLNSEYRLEWDQAHYQYDADYAIAMDYDQDYWLEVYFFDPASGAQQSETHVLKYCRPGRRTLNTQMEENAVSRVWIPQEYSVS